MVASRHDNVRVSIERLVERGVIQLPPMQEVENKQATSPNSKSKVYVFSGEQGKRDSIVVVAQLSPEFTARLVDRWQELEKATGTYQIPQTYPEALRAYADELEAHEKTKQALEAATIRTAHTSAVRGQGIYSWGIFGCADLGYSNRA